MKPHAIAQHFERWKNAAFLVFALVFLGVVYAGGFFRGSYIDDNNLIFANPFIREAGNPLQYWYRGPGNTKAWPLSHSVYWLSFRLFGFRFWAYRLVNLGLHWAVGAALFMFLRKQVRMSSAALVASLFWFHPIAVETVTWIAQINTLLSTLFFAFWLAALNRIPESKKVGLVLLAGMLTTKGFAYFLPVLTLRKRLEGRALPAILSMIPVFLGAAYFVFLVYDGISAQPTDRLQNQLFYQGAEQKIATGQGSIAGKESLWARGYSKVAVCGKVATYYFFRMLSYSAIPGEEPKPESFISWNPLFFSLGLGLFSLLGWCLLRRHYIYAAGALVFLPVSGLFYVPYMKFGLVSDRMAYPALFTFLWGVGILYDRLQQRTLRYAFWIWPLLFLAMAFLAVRTPRAEFPVEFVSTTQGYIGAHDVQDQI